MSSTPENKQGEEGKPAFKPFVPDATDMKEFTVRAVVIGLILTVVLGAANAYLGLRAGMTIAATYPAAILGMALLRLFKGTVLEENITRTVGSIGESVAAGAIFTIPAFFLAGIWTDFSSPEAYQKSTALMIVGGLLGILFVTLLRRVMVEDRDLPFPESVAAAAIHKAGQQGLGAAKGLLQAMAVGGAVYLAGCLKLFTASRKFFVDVGTLGESFIRLGVKKESPVLHAGGQTAFEAPAISPAYLGVGYIIGPELGALNFAGGLLAWGFFVPLLIFVLGPELSNLLGPGVGTEDRSIMIWKFIVRPVAVGGMLVGAANTLYKMRKNLATGLGRAVSDLKKAGGGDTVTKRTDRDIRMTWVFGGLAVAVLAMIAVYYWFTGVVHAAIVAALVMAITGFFFAAVSGNLVGMIGSSNNPISGLTLSTLLIAALLMVLLGVSGLSGVAAVLGVAAVVCVSSAVAGEMLQDLKVGHLLGGTPWKMQVGDVMGVIVAGAVMFFPLLLLHQANIAAGGSGFGDPKLSAPQAGLMASLSQGIVSHQMAWPLVVVGILMGLATVLVKVRSPMLLFVGMYLPLETTAAIFVGGVIKWFIDRMIAKRNELNDAQKIRIRNSGTLVASGLIAGEALMGLVVAGIVLFRGQDLPSLAWGGENWVALVVLAGLALLMIYKPLGDKGRPEDPPPPEAVM